MLLIKFFPIFRDCILGLLFMHKNNIIHRDIKPENILELSSGKVVLSDYGEGVNINKLEKYASGAGY